MGRINAPLRKLLVKIHLYVGLALGAVLSIAGLTGSLIVFWQPIDAALNPALLTPDGGCTEARYQSVDQLVAAARAKMPPNARLVWIDFPDEERPYCGRGLRYRPLRLMGTTSIRCSSNLVAER